MTTSGSATSMRLEAAVDLALHRRTAAGDVDLRRERRLRPAEQRREHLAGLVRVVVDRLLAADHEPRRFLRRPSPSAAWRRRAAAGRRRSRPGSRGRRRAPARCAASPGRPPMPQDTATISVATPFSFRRTASSTAISSNGFIDILTFASVDAGAVGLHADLDVVVDDALDGNEYFHGRAAWLTGNPLIIPRRARLPGAAAPCQPSAQRRSRSRDRDRVPRGPGG